MKSASYLVVLCAREKLIPLVAIVHHRKVSLNENFDTVVRWQIHFVSEKSASRTGKQFNVIWQICLIGLPPVLWFQGDLMGRGRQYPRNAFYNIARICSLLELIRDVRLKLHDRRVAVNLSPRLTTYGAEVKKELLHVCGIALNPNRLILHTFFLNGRYSVKIHDV